MTKNTRKAFQPQCWLSSDSKKTEIYLSIYLHKYCEVQNGKCQIVACNLEEVFFKDPFRVVLGYDANLQKLLTVDSKVINIEERF